MNSVITDTTNYAKNTSASIKDWIDKQPGARRPVVIIVLSLLTAAVIVGATFGVFWLVAQVLGFIVDTATSGGTALGTWVGDQSIVQLFTQPIGDWFSAHSLGLSIAASALESAWWAAGAALYLFALLGSRGAHIGWTLFGVGSAAMAWFGAAAAQRPIAAGAVLAAWCLFSIATFRRRPQQHMTVVARREAPADEPSGDVENAEDDAELHLLPRR